ncbi:hypothetical protein BH23GEM6_BH23GEM6_02670 [soil metagenome]
MKINWEKQRRVSVAIASLIVLLAFIVMAARSRPPKQVEPEMVYSDSIGDARAVGMCAMGRESGTVEGIIVGMIRQEGHQRLQFRVRSQQNSSAEYVMDASSVQVVTCPDSATRPRRPAG